MSCEPELRMRRLSRLLGAVFAISLWAPGLLAQQVPGGGGGAPQAAVAESPADPLGRGTPRGTVLGFLNAARKGEPELARQYLDTRLSGKPAEDLANQLFVVLDARLPARLTQISDAPEGSRANPLRPDQDVVGTISSAAGPVDILVERVRRQKADPVWLFSSTTLDTIPRLYEEVTTSASGGLLPRFVSGARIRGVRLVEWITVLLAIPIAYLLTVLLDRLLVPLVRPLWRRLVGDAGLPVRAVMPVPARLLLLSLVGRWLLSLLPLSLLVRQFWSHVASMLTIVAIVWLLIVIAGEIERHVQRRVPPANASAVASLLRLFRRAAELLIVFAGLLAMLRHFDVDATPALAGLGVGGIAVALAAQKTLENVIAGASLIFDQAVRVGDFLKMGEIVGTVDHIGLRSTRIRTLDRTVISVPNSQIASASLETISARDKFWFHPEVSLRYETTSDQLHAVLDGIRGLLEQHRSVDRESIRVRFFRLGSFSLDVDVFAYLHARDWNHFLEIQEQLLFGITTIVERAGTGIAFPSQTMYVADAQGALAARPALEQAPRQAGTPAR
jgi:MscS family membrane protein